MLKIISHITKAIILIVVSVLCFSCGSDFRSVSGDGNVTTQTRPVNSGFDAVSASGGLEVIIEQGSQSIVTVEADGNLQEHIITEVNGNELKIYTDMNIRNASKKKVTIVLPNIIRISAASGSEVINKGTLKSESLTLDSSSGSNLKANIQVRNVKLETSSGSSLEVVGISKTIEAHASSGSSLDAEKLKTGDADAHASSGGSVTINPSTSLKADASSGGSVIYIKAPAKISKKASSGGSVSLK
ncbi:hypothetical protein AMR72_14505 [Flavobacterium psychrophilum]|nr:hypothetical protein AMR72_14505 [Flavobacterium psychrophilum]AOE53622.1 hypothetical protein ALW18_14495 [Flavobacterium psychrophilum]